MTTLQLLSPAKLNLFLHITGQRSDGYHNLQTLFQLLDYGDSVSIDVHNEARLTLECPGLDVPPEQNLAMRAAGMLQHAAGTDQGAHIVIDKKIPAGGGLGGGSSNAATVLLGLNYLWNTQMSLAELAALGLELGADVPVFVHGNSAWAEGIGEQLTTTSIPPQTYLVVAPPCSVATAEVFRHRQLTRNTAPITIAAFFTEGGRNDCEDVVRELYPEVDNALNFLEKFGPAKLTGTGGCVFLTCDNDEAALAAQRQLPPQWRSFVAAGIDRSPVLDALL